MVAMSETGAMDAIDAPSADDGPWSLPVVVALVASVALPVLVVVALLLGLTGLLGWIPAVIVGLLIGVGLGAFLVVRRISGAAEAVLVELPPDVRRYDRLDNLVEGLRLTAGVRDPAVHIIDDAAANAMAVSRNLNHTLVLTTGLIESLDLVSLEGVVAELMVRLRNGEAERDTVDVALAELPLVGVPGLSGLAAAAAKWARRFGAEQIDHENEDILVDYRAVLLTRYPPGLQSALEKIRDVGSSPACAAELASLWFVDPEASIDRGAGSRPTLDLRIDALAEL